MKKEKKANPVRERKESNFGYILFAITFAVLGVCFIGFTAQAIDMMCYFIGGITIFASALNAVVILAKKDRGSVFYIRMALCILGVVCGVIVIAAKEISLEYIVGTVSLLLIIEASFKLQTVIRLKSIKMPLWWAVVILLVALYAVNVFLIKFYMVDQPKWMLRILGIVLIADGGLNLLMPILSSVAEKRAKAAAETPAEPVAEETPAEPVPEAEPTVPQPTEPQNGCPNGETTSED